MPVFRSALLPVILALALGGCASIAPSHSDAPLGKEAREALNLAHTLRDNGRLQAAYEVYARMDEKGQLDGSYLLEFASLAGAVRPPQEALGLYKRAEQALGDGAPAAQQVALCNGRGRARLSLGQAKQAERDFTCALEAQPGNAQAHNGMGVALNLLNRNDEARQQFEQALESDPSYSPATNNLALSWLASGDSSKAIGLLNAARAQDISIQLNLALAYVIAGQDDTAQRILQDNLEAQYASQILDNFRAARQRIQAGAPLSSELLAASQQPLALKEQD